MIEGDSELDVIRPADPEETAGAFVAALQRTDGPTGLILTTSNVPNLNEISVSDRRTAFSKGDTLPQRKLKSLNSSFWPLEVSFRSPLRLPHNWATPGSPACMERFDRQEKITVNLFFHGIP